jgi:hypothetical protein
MKTKYSWKNLMIILWAGDAAALGIVTLIGFASHGELAEAGLRIFTTFIPLVLAWIFTAYPSKVLDIRNAMQIRQVWKPVWAVCLAVPLASLLRAGFLALRPISPIFILVMMAAGITAILVWRILFITFFKDRIS